MAKSGTNWIEQKYHKSYLFGRWQLSSNFGFVVQATFKGCNKLQHSANRVKKHNSNFNLFLAMTKFDSNYLVKQAVYPRNLALQLKI
jgi:hypothetical protein